MLERLCPFVTCILTTNIIKLWNSRKYWFKESGLANFILLSYCLWIIDFQSCPRPTCCKMYRCTRNSFFLLRFLSPNRDAGGVIIGIGAIGPPLYCRPTGGAAGSGQSIYVNVPSSRRCRRWWGAPLHAEGTAPQQQPTSSFLITITKWFWFEWFLTFVANFIF